MLHGVCLGWGIPVPSAPAVFVFHILDCGGFSLLLPLHEAVGHSQDGLRAAAVGWDSPSGMPSRLLVSRCSSDGEMSDF